MIVERSVGDVLDTGRVTLVEALNEFAGEVAPQLASARSRPALAQLDLELPNVAAVLDVLLALDPARSPDPVTYLIALNLILSLERYLSVRGLWWEKLRWGRALLAYRAGVRAEVLSVVYNLVGSALSELGEDEQAIDLYMLAIETSGLPEDDPELARVYGNLGVAYWNLGRLDEALVYCYRVFELERDRGNRYEMAAAMANVAQLLFDRGDVDTSLAATLEAIQIAEEIGDAILLAHLTATTATHLMGTPLRDEAGPIFEEALKMLAKIGDEIGAALTRLNYAVFCHLSGQPDRAWQLARESLALFERYAMPDAAKARRLLADLDGQATPEDLPPSGGSTAPSAGR